jgi:hypothetical protein
MKIGRAFLGGMIGALVMTAVAGILRLVGMPINLEMMQGSMLLGTVSPAAWVLGLVVHLIIGGVIGIVYAAIFEYAMHHASAGLGLAIGAVHAVISGIFLAFVPALHPLVPELLPAPGVFMLSLGALGVLLFVGLHLMYGAVVGGYYGPAVHERHAAPPLGTRRQEVP